MNSKAIGGYQPSDVVGAVYMSGEEATGPANWAYPLVPGMEPILDAGPLTSNEATGHSRGSANWPYGQEVTTEPLMDAGELTHNTPTGKAHGHNRSPSNAGLRGLGTRGDKKIQKPWNWP